MKKMWSPWRSQYIDNIKQANESNECVFCGLSKLNVDDPKNLLLDKDDKTFTVLNLYPYNNGHLMVVPYRHTSDFNELTDKENLEVMHKLQLAKKALHKIAEPDGFNIGANIGKISGAGIANHIHFHIVPRWNGDTNFMPVLGDVKVISQDLLETKKRLLAAYKELKED